MTLISKGIPKIEWPLQTGLVVLSFPLEGARKTDLENTVCLPV